MIAYEDLDKALARWKARRAGAQAGVVVSAGEGAGSGMGDSSKTPGVVLVETVASFQVHDSTGELDLVDAVLDEA